MKVFDGGDAFWGTFASNDLDSYRAAPCPRCGQKPEVDWIDVTTWGDGNSRWMLPVRAWCETPGCVDVEGGNGVPLSIEVQGRQPFTTPEGVDQGGC